MEEKCPKCPNHCDRDALSCNRGREYFSGKEEEHHDATPQDEVIHLLRKCGHALHHQKEMDTNQFFSSLSEDEINELATLLKKVNL